MNIPLAYFLAQFFCSFSGHRFVSIIYPSWRYPKVTSTALDEESMHGKCKIKFIWGRGDGRGDGGGDEGGVDGVEVEVAVKEA